MQYDKTVPCDNCPFRKGNGAVRLRSERAYEIAHTDHEFACHKTTVECDTDESKLVAIQRSKHCAGFLIYREKQNDPSQMMRIAERCGVYVADRFVNSPHKDQVIDNWREMCQD